ncbi:MAG: LPS-assembly protein LptD [Treponema sp.]|nr:LPS-assembly protein LptD [Treponema sp.]
MKFKRFLLLLCFFSLFLTLYAQEDEEEELNFQPVIIDAEAEAASAQRQRTEMEIRTSTISELASWCRTLGLSESGTREELSRRLREYFDLPAPANRDTSNQKVITIESAQTTEYFSIEVIDEDYARLKGDVRLSLKEDDVIHRISANEILFNRTRNILTARGNVIYERVEADKIETFRGENITVNIDDWSSTFLDGNTSHELESDGAAYLFSGAVISRNNQDVTILRKAIITNASNEEALWSINATRLWLLPGSDFAIFNAVLKVGEIPVLYIPFFYFPGDELVFHPVIGYRSREGGFVQTTTYILGQPKPDPSETSSISRILGNNNDTEKELHGLFLRSTGRKRVNQNEISLKALIDYYVNLGTYIGLDLSVPKTGILNQSELTLGVGFTRTISQVGTNFTPFAPDYDGSSDWNHSSFFSTDVPFRYRMRFNSSISGRYGGLFWDFPYYSDPFVDNDFVLNRSESMDFMNMIQQGAAFDDSISTTTQIGSYQWHINGNLNPSLPFLAPAITRITISNLSSTLSFKTIRDVSFGLTSEAPGRFFYAPDKYTIYSLSSSITGTPITINRAQRNNETAIERVNPLEGIGIPVSPWGNNETLDSGVQPWDDSIVLFPPVLNQNFTLPRTGNNRFSVDYTIAPTSSSELQFMNNKWDTYDQIDWNEIQSVLYTYGGTSNVNFRLDHTTGLYSNVVTFAGTGTWRDYSFLNEEAFANQEEITRLREQQYRQTNYSTSYNYNSTVRPFHENLIFRQTNFQYGFRGTLVRSQRYTGGDGPELTPQWGAWVKEKPHEDIFGLNNHQVAANLAANVMDMGQNISVSAALPPLDGLVSTNATFRVWISETNVNFRVEKPELSDDWIYRPIHITETLKFGNIGSYSYYMVLDPEEDNEITTIRSILTLWGFKADYSAIKTTKSHFVLDPDLGGMWEQKGEAVLRPRDLTLSYTHMFSNYEIIQNRLITGFNINTSLSFNLQQHTNSNFQLSLGYIIFLPGFLRLELAATSQNAVIWRYFKNVQGMEHLTFMYPDGPQNNLFTDLIDSFNFGDESKRRRTGFKMHSFDLSAIHFLGDWQAEFKVNVFPYSNPQIVPRRYEITADISFLVQWKPITEIKSHVNYHGKNDRWEIQ